MKRSVIQTQVVRVVLVAAGLAAVTGCESADSEDIRTSGIYATFSAESDGSSTKAVAVLRVGGAASNTFVKLSNGDTLTVSAAGQTQALMEVNLLQAYSYQGTFSAVNENAAYVFNFDRATDTEDAPNSNVNLPATFAISAPAAASQFSRSAPITVTWAPSGTTDRMSLEVRGDCIQTRILDVTGDPGTFTINGGTINPLAGRTADNCSSTITVRRARTGTLDPAFTEGGSVVGIQARQVGFRSDP